MIVPNATITAIATRSGHDGLSPVYQAASLSREIQCESMPLSRNERDQLAARGIAAERRIELLAGELRPIGQGSDVIGALLTLQYHQRGGLVEETLVAVVAIEDPEPARGAAIVEILARPSRDQATVEGGA